MAFDPLANHKSKLSMDNIYDLLVDLPELNEDEGKKLQQLILDFVHFYEQNKERPMKDWLEEKLSLELPDKSPVEIVALTQEIIETLTTIKEKKESLTKAIEIGKSKEGWLKSEIKMATSTMSAQETENYLQTLDQALENANILSESALITQAGTVSKNPNLDGYIAEFEHVNSFNLNAELSGSEYRAKVLQPEGTTYAKNGVDIVIADGAGKIVRRYQSKYCKDAKATLRAFEQGNYRGQQSLVPEGQSSQMPQKATEYLEAPDGTCSTPLSKQRAQQLRDEAQSGKWNDKSWNDYKTSDVALGIGRQTVQASLMGAALGTGMELVHKISEGENIGACEVAKMAIETGVDSGVKAAITGAVKVGAEKDVIRCIPKGTPASTIGSIVSLGVDNAKILYRMAKGDISGRQALEGMEVTTFACVGGLMAKKTGVALGAAIGAVMGPIGSAVGSFVGGCVASIAGSKVGKMVAKTSRAIRNTATKVISYGVSAVKSAVSFVAKKISSFFSWW